MFLLCVFRVVLIWVFHKLFSLNSFNWVNLAKTRSTCFNHANSGVKRLVCQISFKFNSHNYLHLQSPLIHLFWVKYHYFCVSTLLFKLLLHYTSLYHTVTYIFEGSLTESEFSQILLTSNIWLSRGQLQPLRQSEQITFDLLFFRFKNVPSRVDSHRNSQSVGS